MSYCPHCGVEVSSDADACPLCFFDMRIVNGKETSSDCPDPIVMPASEIREALGAPNQRTLIWEVYSVAALIAAVVVCAVNVLDTGSLTWALYPLFSLACMWVLLTAGLMLYGKPAAAIAISALSIPVFLVSLDAIDGKLSWGFPLAVPIALVSELAVTGAVVATLQSKRLGMNVIAYILATIAVICIGIETTLDLYSGARISLYWSAVTSIALFPMAVFFFYLHHRVVRKANLRKLLRF